MSLWRKLFRKSDAPGAPPRLSLKEQYQVKLRRYLDLIQISRAAQDALGELDALLAANPPDWGRIQAACNALADHSRGAAALLSDLCKEPQPEVLAQAAALADQLQAGAARLTAGEGDAAVAALRDLVCPAAPPPSSDSCPEAPTLASCTALRGLLDYITHCRLGEMFCLTLKGPITKKEACSLVTGRLVPILVIDAGGGLAREAATVNFDAVTSIPYRAFLTGMMSIPWPKARPVDMKGFISVVGVTSTTPRAEGQLQKLSFALLARHYMNFSLCLGYHASTVEAYVAGRPADNYIRFHYEGGAASVDRRVRRLRLIAGILTRLGFAVTITGDLLDGRRTAQDDADVLQTLEILGRLEVFTKQMDMVLADDTVAQDFIDDFLATHC